MLAEIAVPGPAAPGQLNLHETLRYAASPRRHPGRRTPGTLLADPACGLRDEIRDLADRLEHDGTSIADLRLMRTALKEMRWACRVFSKFRGIRKVTTFGSARTPPGSPAWEQARTFAARITELGYMVITGAGPGIMEACQMGSGRERSFGINIRLPFEQQPNPVIGDDPKLINFKYFFTRKLFLMKEADAVVLFPGGFGTHDEGFEALTLIQTGKAPVVPVVFIETPDGHYWGTWREYVEQHLRDQGLISPSDMDLFRVTDDVDDAVAEIVRFYRCYHSSRWVGEYMVLRLQVALAPALVTDLAQEFADALHEPVIEQRPALPEEADEPALAHLPRLVVPLRRRSAGRLRRLIDRINSA